MRLLSWLSVKFNNMIIRSWMYIYIYIYIYSDDVLKLNSCIVTLILVKICIIIFRGIYDLTWSNYLSQLATFWARFWVVKFDLIQFLSCVWVIDRVGPTWCKIKIILWKLYIIKKLVINYKISIIQLIHFIQYNIIF